MEIFHHLKLENLRQEDTVLHSQWNNIGYYDLNEGIGRSIF